MLARALHQTRTLREFQLFGNRIGNLGAESLAAVMLKKRVGEKCFIRTLGLASNSIGDSGAMALASALQQNTLCSVTCLDLGCNRIGDDGAKAFAETLKTNEKLCELFLWHNEIKYAFVRHDSNLLFLKFKI
jgi:Ran GTPase-activating protein (RanGAP) involved in mRNA processing and transport